MRYTPGFRTYLPPQIQWQPTLTSHDPNPPIPIDEAAGGTTTEVRTLSISGIATPTFISELLAESTVAIVGDATVTAVAEQVQESVLSVTGAASASFLNDTASLGSPGGWDKSDEPGFDPYRYKPRKGKRKPRDEVNDFLKSVVGLPPSAPDEIAEQAVAAKVAANDYLKAVESEPRDVTLAALDNALEEIRAFHALLTAEIARRQEEEDDEDFLLLAS